MHTNTTMDTTYVTITAADVDLLRRGMLQGNLYVISAIECEGIRVHLSEPGRWYDTRPMLDLREHSPQLVDMAAETLAYAIDAGLARRHSQQPHLVCLLVTA